MARAPSPMTGPPEWPPPAMTMLPAPIPQESRAFACHSAVPGHGLCLADIRMTAADEAADTAQPSIVERPQGLHPVAPHGRGSDARITRFAAWLRDEAATEDAGEARPGPSGGDAPDRLHPGRRPTDATRPTSKR